MASFYKFYPMQFYVNYGTALNQKILANSSLRHAVYDVTNKNS